MEVYCASGKKDLFSFPFGDKYHFKGTTDITIVESVYMNCKDIRGGIRMAMELKKEISEIHIRQAVLELIAANSVSNYPVVIVLTDLRHQWLFYWISTDSILQCSQNL